MTSMSGAKVTNFFQKRVANPLMRRNPPHVWSTPPDPAGRQAGRAPILVRLRELPRFNGFGVRAFGANLLTLRVDLD